MLCPEGDDLGGLGSEAATGMPSQSGLSFARNILDVTSIELPHSRVGAVDT